MKLTRPLVVPLGVNALGGIQVFIGLAPLWIQPDVAVGTTKRLLLLLTGLIVVATDIWWRASDKETSTMTKVASPFAGGSIIYLPGWLFGLGVAGLAIFAMVTVR